MYGEEEPAVFSPEPMAFPVPPECQCGGMTLRDYFAAAALTGLLAGNWQAYPDDVSAWAYSAADAMVERRNK